MREPELAARYRDRVNRQQRTRDLVGQIFDDGLTHLRRGANGWLVVAAAPNRAGRLSQVGGRAVEMSREWLREVLPQTAAGSAWSPDSAASVGRRRVIHSSEYDYTGLSLDWHLELHHDGSGFAAQRLATAPTWEGEPYPRPPEPQPHVWLDTVDVARWSATLTQLLAAHAVRVGAGGDLTVTAHLLGVDPEQQSSWQLARPGSETPQATYSVRAMRLGLAEPVILANPDGSFDQAGLRAAVGTRRLAVTRSVIQTVSLTVANDFADLASTTALLVGDLLAEFGLPEPPAFRLDGTINHEDLRASQYGSLLGWAQRLGR